MSRGEGSGDLSANFAWSIPLKPTEKPLDLPDSVAKTAHEEYVVRYLESIGAEPTAANIAMVRKQIPFKQVKLTAAFKSRGSLEDTLHIQQKDTHLEPRRPWKAAGGKSLFSDVAARHMEGRAAVEGRSTPNVALRATPTLPSGVRAPQPSSKEPIDKLPKQRAKVPLLTEVERNLLTQQAVTMGSARNRADNVLNEFREVSLSPTKGAGGGAGGAGGVQSTAAGGAAGGAATTTARPTPTPSEGSRAQSAAGAVNDSGHIPIEPLDQPLEVTIEDILAIQTMFTRSFPFESMQHRITPDDEALAMAEMTSISMAQLIKHICTFLHTAVIKPGPSRPDDDWLSTLGLSSGGEVDDMLLTVYDGYVDLLARLKKKSHVVLLFPLFLLAMRVTIETVFRNNFPKVFNFYGEETLAKLDILLELLFDPDAYHKNLSLLTAFKPSVNAGSVDGVSGGVGAGGGAGRRRNAGIHAVSKKFYTTSPMVKDLIGRGANPRVRSMLVKSERLNPRPVMGGRRDVSGLPMTVVTKRSVNALYNIALRKYMLRNTDGGLQRKAATVHDSLDMLLPIFSSDALTMEQAETSPAKSTKSSKGGNTRSPHGMGRR